jgi:serine/threonine protein kinase
MDADRLRKLQELYHSACERPDSQRQAYLEAECGGDTALLGAVLSLCRQASEGGLLDRPAIDCAAELLAGGPPSQVWEPGERVGAYRIEKRLGSGAMGDVFEARDTRLGRSVAIKRGRQEFSGRFQREARAISALNHPNICTLYDIGPDFLVMELVEGQTLAERIAKRPLKMTLARAYGAQIAGALAAAHARGVVHRDLKPANIMVTKSGVKVLDFGLAKFDETAVGATAETATGSGVIVGTPAYMAPEQIEGKGCDARTDIFALGLVLYEMAAGKRAFGAGSRAAVTDQILHAEAPALSGVSREFALVVDRCLAKDPDNRWQSARPVAAAF